MFFGGFVVGVVVTLAAAGGLYRWALRFFGLSDREASDIWKLIFESSRHRTAVVEVWKNHDYNTGNADLVGQVFLEKE